MEEHVAGIVHNTDYSLRYCSNYSLGVHATCAFTHKGKMYVSNSSKPFLKKLDFEKID
jgi:hypothetical protein